MVSDPRRNRHRRLRKDCGWQEACIEKSVVTHSAYRSLLSWIFGSPVQWSLLKSKTNVRWHSQILNAGGMNE